MYVDSLDHGNLFAMKNIRIILEEFKNLTNDH